MSILESARKAVEKQKKKDPDRYKARTTLYEVPRLANANIEFKGIQTAEEKKAARSLSDRLFGGDTKGIDPYDVMANPSKYDYNTLAYFGAVQSPGGYIPNYDKYNKDYSERREKFESRVVDDMLSQGSTFSLKGYNADEQTYISNNWDYLLNRANIRSVNSFAGTDYDETMVKYSDIEELSDTYGKIEKNQDKIEENNSKSDTLSVNELKGKINRKKQERTTYEATAVDTNSKAYKDKIAKLDKEIFDLEQELQNVNKGNLGLEKQNEKLSEKADKIGGRVLTDSEIKAFWEESRKRQKELNEAKRNLSNLEGELERAKRKQKENAEGVANNPKGYYEIDTSEEYGDFLNQGEKIVNLQNKVDEAKDRVLALEPTRDATIWEATAKALQKGYYQAQLGREYNKKANGQANEVEKYEKILSRGEYNFEASGFKKILSGASEQIGLHFMMLTDAQTIAMASTAAAMVWVAGTAGPQAAIPEEIITVPTAMAAAIRTSLSGLTYQIESGFAYKEMLDAGISPKTSMVVANLVGGVNAGIELLPIGDLLGASFALAGSDNIATKTVGKAILDGIITAGEQAVGETAEEVMQESVTMLGVNAAAKKDLGKNIIGIEEGAKRLGETAVDSFLTFGAMGVPAIGGASLNAGLIYGVKKADEHLLNKSFNSYANRGLRAEVITSVLDRAETFSDVKIKKQAENIKTKFENGDRVTLKEVQTLEKAIEKATEDGTAVVDENAKSGIENNIEALRKGESVQNSEKAVSVKREGFGRVSTQNILKAKISATKTIGKEDGKRAAELSGEVVRQGTEIFTDGENNTHIFASVVNINGKKQIISAVVKITEDNTAYIQRVTDESGAVIADTGLLFDDDNSQLMSRNSGIVNTDKNMKSWVYEDIERNKGEVTPQMQTLFDELYNFGSQATGERFETAFEKIWQTISKDTRYANVFDYSDARMIYNAGFQDARVKKEGGLVKNGNHMKLSKTQRADLDAIGKNFKVQIEVVDNIPGEALNVKGLYQNGKIYIKVSDNGGIVIVAGHELIHRMKEVNPEGYTVYEKYALAYELEKRKEYFDSIDEMVEYIQEQARKKSNKEIGVDLAKEEIVANFTGDLLSDDVVRGEFLESLDKADKHTPKIIEFIKNFIKKIFPHISDKKVKADFEKVIEELSKFGRETKQIIESGKEIKTNSEGKNYTEGVDFNKQVDMALDKTMPRSHSVYIGKTPNLLQKAGLSDLPMLISQSHMRDINHIKDKRNIHWHGLSREIIKQIPKQLKEPVMIYDSISQDNKENAICVVTSLKDSDGLPIIITIRANSEEAEIYIDTNFKENRIKKSNFVTSAYGRNNFEKHIDEVIEQDALIYARKSKTLKLFSDIGLQLPERLNNLGFDKIIHQSRNLVNSNSMQNNGKYSTEGVDLESAKEIKRLKNENKELRRQFKETAFTVPEGNSIKKFARELKALISSKMKNKEIEAMLYDVYELSANMADYREVNDKALELSRALVEMAETVDDLEYQKYENLVRQIKKNGFSLNETQKAEFAQGEYNSLRKANMGKIKIINSGVNIEQLYAELSEQYPEFFNYENEFSTPERLNKIIEVMERIAPVTENLYGEEFDNAVENFKNIILTSIIEYSPTGKPTFADKANQRLRKAELEFQKKLEALQKKRNDEAIKVREEYIRKIEKRDTNRRMTVSLSSIRHNAERLNKRLSTVNSKTHIKEELRKPIERFINAVDITENGRTDRGKELNLKEILDAYQGVSAVFGKNAKVLYGEDGFHYVDRDLTANLERIVDYYGEKVTIENLDLFEINQIRNAVLNVIHIADYENKAFSDSLNGKISEISESVMEENGRLYMGQDKERFTGLKNLASWLSGFEQFNPLTAFHIMGPSMEKLYHALRLGFDKKIGYVNASEKFMESNVKSFGIDIKKLRKEIVDFEINETVLTKDGYKNEKFAVKMSRAQLISLYLVYRQYQGKMHLFDEHGGIIIGGIDSEKLTKSNVYKPTEADIKNVLNKLTDNEKQFAAGISSFFMDEVASWANEASMVLYGYEKFNTSNYFPLRIESKSAQENALITSSKKKQAKIENVSYAKVREQDAAGAVIISDILDVYTGYTDKMSSYSAFSAPLADLQRVMNYTEGKASVVKSLDGRFHGRAVNYINDFAEAVNDNVIAGYDNNEMFDRLLRNAKISAVGFKLSVALKQPTALVRALAVMNPKDLLGLTRGFREGSGEIMYKYAPVALWKKYGFFDINTGRNMENIILGNQGALDSFRETSMALAGIGDELTFRVIWGACDREIHRLHPEISRNTEAFYKKVGERFSEVIDKTQVVDSVFHRSKIMRSDSFINKMFTAFQSEPKATYNLLVYQAYDVYFAKNGKAKAKASVQFGRAVLATLFSSLLASAVGLGVQTIKMSPTVLLMGFDPYDDEDDKEAWYKKLLKNGLNDYAEMFQWWGELNDIIAESFSLDLGFENVNDLIKIVKQIAKMFDKDEEKIPEETWHNLLPRLFLEASKVTGVPIEGLKQFIEMGIGHINIFTEGKLNEEWRYKLLKNLYYVKGTKFKKAYKQWLFDAYISGDREAYDTLRRLGMNDGFKASEIDGWVKTKISKYEKENGEVIPQWGTSWQGTYLAVEEEKETSESFNDVYDKLSYEEVMDFEDRYEEIYDRLSSEYGEDLLEEFRSGSDEEKAWYNDAIKCFQNYAKEQALAEASDGAWEIDTQWIRDAEDVCEMYNIDVGKFIYLGNVYGKYLELDGTWSHNIIYFGFSAEDYYKFNKKYNDIRKMCQSKGLKEPKKAFLNQLRKEGYSEAAVQKVNKAFSSKKYWE